jgi:hypothetical protein
MKTDPPTVPGYAPDGGYPPERAAQFETLVEGTAPPPDDARCRCDRCIYGERPRLTLSRDEDVA